MYIYIYICICRMSFDDSQRPLIRFPISIHVGTVDSRNEAVYRTGRITVSVLADSLTASAYNVLRTAIDFFFFFNEILLAIACSVEALTIPGLWGCAKPLPQNTANCQLTNRVKSLWPRPPGSSHHRSIRNSTYLGPKPISYFSDFCFISYNELGEMKRKRDVSAWKVPVDVSTIFRELLFCLFTFIFCAVIWKKKFQKIAGQPPNRTMSRARKKNFQERRTKTVNIPLIIKKGFAIFAMQCIFAGSRLRREQSDE